METPYSARIILDGDMELKLLEIFYCANEDAVERIYDRNVHKRKVVGEVKVSVGEVHGPKVRDESVNLPKRCSCTVIC